MRCLCLAKLRCAALLSCASRKKTSSTCSLPHQHTRARPMGWNYCCHSNAKVRFFAGRQAGRQTFVNTNTPSASGHFESNYFRTGRVPASDRFYWPVSWSLGSRCCYRCCLHWCVSCSCTFGSAHTRTRSGVFDSLSLERLRYYCYVPSNIPPPRLALFTTTQLLDFKTPFLHLPLFSLLGYL